MSKRTPDAMVEAVGTEALGWALAEMVNSVLSVPEAERVGWYRAMEAYASRQRRHQEGVLANAALATEWCRIARIVWPEWPPQD